MKQTDKNAELWRWGFYAIGTVCLALGLTLNTKTGLGVAPILTVPFAISKLWNVNFAFVTFVVYSIFVVLQFLLKGKNRNWKDILQFPFSMVFSLLLNLFGKLMPIAFSSVWQNLLLLAAAMVITAVGVSMMVNMRLIPNPADGLANTLGEVTKKGMGTGKNILDLSCAGIAAVICLLCGKGIVGIGIGTLIAMIGVGRFIAVFQKYFRAKMLKKAALEER